MVRFVALLVAATFVVLTSAVKSEFWKETTRITKPAVCELISPYHDSAIAAAGDAKHLIREAYVINDDFFSCVLAAPRPLQKRPIKTKEQVGDGAGGGAGV